MSERCEYCLEDVVSLELHAPECVPLAWWRATTLRAAATPRLATATFACEFCGYWLSTDERESHDATCGQRRWWNRTFANQPERVVRPPKLEFQSATGETPWARVRAWLSPSLRAFNQQVRSLVDAANGIRDDATYALISPRLHELLGHAEDSSLPAEARDSVARSMDILVKQAEGIEHLLDALQTVSPMDAQRAIEQADARGHLIDIKRLESRIMEGIELSEQIDREKQALRALADEDGQRRLSPGLALHRSLPSRAHEMSGNLQDSGSLAGATGQFVDPRDARAQATIEGRRSRAFTEPGLLERATAPVMSFARHQQIGEYRVLGLVGSGGMGIVFEALAPTGQRVAIKLIRDTTQHARVMREVAIMRRIDHPRCVSLREVGQHDRQMFIVMNLIAGASLARILEERRLMVAEVIHLGSELCEVIAHLHQHGVLHRDLKPANILIDREGHAILADFGIARLAEPHAPRLTEDGHIVGTQGFIAPEVALGQDATPASDQWSLGRLLFECVCGPTLQALSLEAVAKKETIIPWSEFPQTREWGPTRAILERMLAFDPAQRFSDLETTGRAFAQTLLE